MSATETNTFAREHKLRETREYGELRRRPVGEVVARARRSRIAIPPIRTI